MKIYNSKPTWCKESFSEQEKGIINKERYCLPKSLIAGFDGHTLYLRIMKAESKQYRQDDMKL